VGGKIGFALCCGTHAPPPACALVHRTLPGSNCNVTNAWQMPCATLSVPPGVEHVLSAKNVPAPIWHATPLGELQEHVGQMGPAPARPTPPVAISVGKPPASPHSGGVALPLASHSASGPTQPPGGTLGAHVNRMLQSGSAQSTSPSPSSSTPFPQFSKSPPLLDELLVELEDDVLLVELEDDELLVELDADVLDDDVLDELLEVDDALVELELDDDVMPPPNPPNPELLLEVMPPPNPELLEVMPPPKPPNPELLEVMPPPKPPNPELLEVMPPPKPPNPELLEVMPPPKPPVPELPVALVPLLPGCVSSYATSLRLHANAVVAIHSASAPRRNERAMGDVRGITPPIVNHGWAFSDGVASARPLACLPPRRTALCGVSHDGPSR
jgi:hypothetical protein